MILARSNARQRLRISILIHNVYGVGGTNRAVINLSQALAARGHDVQIASVFRRLDQPVWAIDPRVRIVPLVDTRPGSADRTDVLQWQRSSVVPPHEEYYTVYSQLSDQRIRDYLVTAGCDVFIGTRAALNLAVAAWAPDGAVRVAQEHQTHVTLPDDVRQSMGQAYSRMDAAVTVTRADADAFRTETPIAGLRIENIPNIAPRPELPDANLDTRTIIAAGRLDPVKRYDVLLRAFASITDRLPGWQLRIYGAGPEEGRLRRLLDDLGLADRALLMGQYPTLDQEWVKASVGVSTSDRESFGMSIVEAMRCGVPMVSTRAPVGPEEIITDGEDGLLVRVGDPDGVGSALLSLCSDHDLRQRMGQAAKRNTLRYDPDSVATQYEALLAELHRGRRQPGVGGWLSAVGRHRNARSTPPTEQPAAAPRSRVICDDAGNLELRLEDPDAAYTYLRFRVRGRADIVDVPLRRLGDQAVADVAARDLPEARWNVYALGSAQRVVRLAYDIADLRASVAPRLPDVGPFCRLLPYRPDDGGLAVRSWMRRSHAECERVDLADGVVAVRGRLLWEGGAAELDQAFADRLQGDFCQVAGTVVNLDDRGSFRVEFDLDRLAKFRVTRHDDWHLFIRARDGRTARLSRLADDIVDRKAVYRYPEVQCRDPYRAHLHEEYPVRTINARAYFSVHSDLAVNVIER